MALPHFLHAMFWDVQFEKLDPIEDRDFIIARIAEHGTDEAVRWLRKTYGDDDLVGALERRSAQVSERTLGLWRLWLGKPEDWCARNPSRPLKGVFWKS